MTGRTGNRLIANNSLYSDGDLLIEKFGGDVLGARGEGLNDVLQRLSEFKGSHLLILSALRGVTDTLKEYNNTKNESLLQERLVSSYLSDHFNSSIYESLNLKAYMKNLRAMTDAEILGLGEILSTDLLYSFLKTKGVNVGKVNFLNVNSHSDPQAIESNLEFPIVAKQYRVHDADPDLEASRSKMKEVKELLETHNVVVTPGFVARYRDGRAVTLGRGGSDTSLFVYADCLRVPQGILWKSTEGVRSANPDIVPRHRLVKYFTALEGLNLTLFGGGIVNFKGMEIAYKNDITVKVAFVKDSQVFTTISRENPSGETKEQPAVKYVGGTADAVLLHFDLERMKNRVDRLVERNLGDFVHIFGPALNPTVAVLDATKYYEISDEEGWSEKDGMRVAAVGIIGEGLGEMRGALAEAARVVGDLGVVIHGNLAATRRGTQGGYMTFFVDRPDYENVVRSEHARFIEIDNGFHESIDITSSTNH